MADPVGIKAILYTRLSASDLQRLRGEAGSTDWISFGKFDFASMPALFDHAHQSVAWEEGAKSRSVEVVVEQGTGPDGTSFPSRRLRFLHRKATRQNELVVSYQRRKEDYPEDQLRPLEIWQESIDADQPAQDCAYLALICDSTGTLHASYLRNREDQPEALRERLTDSHGQIVLDGVFLRDEFVQRVYVSLLEEKNVIVYGPPGTGKSWLMSQVRKAFENGTTTLSYDPSEWKSPIRGEKVERPELAGIPTGRDARRTELVTFHQSSSYESFIAGIRPSIGEEGGIRYEVEIGPLVEMADFASAEKQASLLLIDEINRGNTAEVFGELITLLEKDKRTALQGASTLEDDESTEWSIRLPVSPDDTPNGAVKDGRLRLPEHLFFLATMNSVDRSVAPLDSALRRRFRIIYVPPRTDLLRDLRARVRGIGSDEDRQLWEKASKVALDLLDRINRFIICTHGPDFQLGHAYLWDAFVAEPEMSGRSRARRLVSAYFDGILPQLREIYRDQPDLFETLLGKASTLLAERVTPLPEWRHAFDVDDSYWLRFRTDLPTLDGALEILGMMAGASSDSDDVESEEPDESAAGDE
jgi:hypothetical protein